jgi:hypothetical protein
MIWDTDEHSAAEPQPKGIPPSLPPWSGLNDSPLEGEG